MSEIATAFVRVRADTTGFRGETQAAAKGAALGAAKVFAGVFAGVKLFDFAKSAVDEAAQTQKATENIRAQFKGSSEDVLQFGEDAAKAFGISRQASETFSSQIGLAGKNLGLTSRQTAEMDVGFQKLAGSVGLIKGIDPASIFDQLKLALLGNVRGLKQLGISVDTTREKQALLDAGVIKATVNEAAVAKARLAVNAATKAASDAVDKYGKDSSQAAVATNDVQLKQQAYKKALEGTVAPLTAAQKAQAIYLLATKQLPGFLDQARKHSGDLADEQRHLTAEWQNAKEEIGSALLPQVTRLEGGLLDVLHAAEENKGSIKAVFEGVGTALTPVTASVKFLADNMRVVGPIAEGLAISFVTLKTATLAAGIAQGLYGTAMATANTVSILATGGTTALAEAQAAQAASAAAAAAGEVAVGAAAAEAEVPVAVLSATLLANPFGIAALAIAGGAGLIFALTRLGGSTDALAGPFGRASDAVDSLKQSLDDERDSIFALTHDNLGLRQAHLDLVKAQAASAASNADVAAAQKLVNQLQRDGETGTKKYRDAQAALTAAKQDATQKTLDLQGVELRQQELSAQQVKDLKDVRTATQDATGEVKGYRDSFTELSDKAKTTQSSLSAMAKKFPIEEARRAAAGVASYASKTQDLSAKIRDGLPELEQERKKADALAASFGDSDSKAARAARAYARNADAAVAASKKLAKLESTASLLSQAWGRIVDLPTAQFFIKETTQLTTIENNRLRRAGGGGIPAGALSLTGEQGPELSIASTGRQIISKGDTVGLFREIGSGLTAVARALEEQAARSVGAGGPAIVIEHQTVQTDTPQDFLKQLAAMVPR